MVSSLNDWKVLDSLESKFVASVDFIAVSSYDWDEQCALLVSDGEVFAVGRSDVGCLGLANKTSADVPCKIKELSGVAGVCVCAYYGDALAYTKEGDVYVWGDNVNATSCKTPSLVSGLTDVVDARCDRGYYLALSRYGKVYEWRGNETEHLTTLATVQTLVTIDDVIVGIACSHRHTLALTEKDVYIWGVKYNPTLTKYEDLPVTKISIPGGSIAKVACSDCYSLVLTRSGKMFTWGYYVHGLGNHGYFNYLAAPVQVGGNIGRFTDIATNCSSTSAAVTDTGAVYMWGEGEILEQWVIPTITQHTEVHQVFAKISHTNLVWKCNSSDSIYAAGSACNREELEEYDRKSEENTVILHKTLRLESDYSKLQVEFCGVAKEHSKLEGKLESLEKLYMKLQDKSERLDKSCIKQNEKLKRLEEEIKTQEYKSKGEDMNGIARLKEEVEELKKGFAKQGEELGKMRPVAPQQEAADRTSLPQD